MNADPSTDAASHPPPRPDRPPEAWEPLLRLARLARRPLDRFLAIEAASGVLLLVAAAVALGLANSPFADDVKAFWQTPVGLQIGEWQFARSLEWIVNDGLMAIFFFVVGMEIRREIHHGELSTLRRAALPAAAALGGMVAPAAIYLAFAGAPEIRSGWGVPMATDIAFAVGVLTLLGRRVPPALRVLLLALAVIDDLGAIIVIAVFYTAKLEMAGFGVAGLGLLGVLLLQRLGVRHPSAYLAPAIVAWAGTYAAGIHPTIAGVVIGLLTPVRAWLGPEGFSRALEDQLGRLSGPGAPADDHALAHAIRGLSETTREAVSPAETLIARLHPWVAFGIMPIFALANAGVRFDELSIAGPTAAVALGCAVGLVLGKPVGILLMCWLTVRSKLGSLPAGIGFRHLLVLGVVAGIGFTMSLFIAQLAFTDAGSLGAAKLGVLAGTGVAGILGLGLGVVLLRPIEPAPPTGPTGRGAADADAGAPAESADAAEASTTA
jgi:NhaA family Na+:H+ antiporter